MRSLNMLLIAWLCATAASAQFMAAEVMLGNTNYWYQHNVAVSFPKDSRFGLSHVSSLHLLYNDGEKNEVMSQSYLTFRLSPSVSLAGGTFYASKPGISPSLAMQFRFAHRHLRGVIVPRVDLKNNGSIEGMTMIEYLPPITEQLTFYSRLQLMSNYGPRKHNRSYQNIRMGIRLDKSTLGFALNIDERGAEMNTLRNWGIFLRYDI